MLFLLYPGIKPVPDTRPLELIESSNQFLPYAAQQQKKKPTRMNTVGTLSASLLVCSHVLKGSVGEAWIAALAVTNKFQASNKDVSHCSTAGMDFPFVSITGHACDDADRYALAGKIR